MKKKGNALAQSMPVEPNMDYEHQQNHDTVMKAMEIMGDPEKMKHVHKLSGRKSKAIKSLKDLHSVYQEKYGKAEKEEGPAHEAKESKKMEAAGE